MIRCGCMFVFACVMASTCAPALSAQSAGGLMGGGPLAGEECVDCLSEVDRGNLDALIALTADPADGYASGVFQYALYPMGGIINQDFSITNYMDLNSGPGIQTFDCGVVTYNGHDASDAALRTFDEQSIGVPIYAACDGTVIASHDGEPDMNTVWANQPANYVVIDHGNGRVTNYFHMKLGSVAVAPGATVVAGQQIGLVGSSGNSTGPHLHFGTFINGVSVEPFAGPCNTTTTGLWAVQPPSPGAARMLDFAYFTNPLNGISPPFSMPRTGEKLLSATDVRFWTMIEPLPAQSTWRVRFYRPNGTLSFDSGTGNFNNNSTYTWSWWWWSYPIGEMQTIPGTWTTRLTINGVDLVTAPIDVSAGAVANRAPEPITVVLTPIAPTDNDIIEATVTSSSLIDDRDYEIVRHRWQWFVNGAQIRDVTTASRSDRVPRSISQTGDTVSVTVTPNDPFVAGTPVTVSVVVGSGILFPGSGEDFAILTGVNAAPTRLPDFKPATAGDQLSVMLNSPGGTFVGTPPVLAGQLTSGGAPANAPGFPELHLQVASSVILWNGLSVPIFGTSYLPLGGLAFQYPVPGGLVGSSAILQGFAITTAAANGFFAATDAHEIRIQ